MRGNCLFDVNFIYTLITSGQLLNALLDEKNVFKYTKP